MLNASKLAAVLLPGLLSGCLRLPELPPPGAETPVFKTFPGQVPELSLERYQAAKDRARDAPVAADQGMVTARFDCHSAYRERVAAVLGNAR